MWPAPPPLSWVPRLPKKPKASWAPTFSLSTSWVQCDHLPHAPNHHAVLTPDGFPSNCSHPDPFSQVAFVWIFYHRNNKSNYRKWLSRLESAVGPLSHSSVCPGIATPKQEKARLACPCVATGNDINSFKYRLVEIL